MRPPYARRIWLGALLAAVLAAPACSEDYLRQIRDGGYDSIFTARIVSADTVPYEGGSGICYFKYTSEITRTAQGKTLPAKFDFSSNMGLPVGSEYLVYFSAEDAKLKRFGTGQRTQCQNDFSGYLLVPQELHRLDRIWDGKKLVEVVEFNNALETVPPAHQLNQTDHFADLDYVLSELKKP